MKLFCLVFFPFPVPNLVEPSRLKVVVAGPIKLFDIDQGSVRASRWQNILISFKFVLKIQFAWLSMTIPIFSFRNTYLQSLMIFFSS
jgi:hypothetical protein